MKCICEYIYVFYSLAQLTHLKKLNLDSNSLSAGVPAVIGDSASLEQLKLRGCIIKGPLQSTYQNVRYISIGLFKNVFCMCSEIFSEICRVDCKI